MAGEKDRALGCLPLSDAEWQWVLDAASDAVTLGEYSWADGGDMPVLKWDSFFTDRLAERSELREKYERAGYSLRPWDILRSLPRCAYGSDVYCWNQGSLPSCSMHGAAHAYQSAELVAIALGSPLRYEALNPIYSFYWARGGNFAGGLSIWDTAETANRDGFLPVSLVGDDNTSVSSEGLKLRDRGTQWQAAVMWVEDDPVESIISACRGLCSVCFGSGSYYSGCTVDGNGVRVMSGRARGGHAQCFTGYLIAGGEEYVFNLNSHGPIYTAGSDKTLPKSGAWVTRRQLEVYARDFEAYGYPFVVFPEGEFRREPSLANDFTLPRLDGSV